MKLLVGTSGYSFKDWKGTFYPAELRSDQLLGSYASNFPTVEINNTFPRLPKEHVPLEWASDVDSKRGTGAPLKDCLNQTGNKARIASFADAAAHGEVVTNATSGPA